MNAKLGARASKSAKSGTDWAANLPRMRDKPHAQDKRFVLHYGDLSDPSL